MEKISFKQRSKGDKKQFKQLSERRALYSERRANTQFGRQEFC